MDALPPHHRPGGGFRNPWPGANPREFRHLVRWFIERNFLRRPPPDPDPSVFLPLATPRLGLATAPGTVATTWLGHSAVLLEFQGVTALTDPMLGSYASPIPTHSLRRWVPVPLALEALPPLDLILLSHNHYDHLDRPSVKRLAELHPHATWVTPLRNGPLLRTFGVKEIRELDWWETATLGPATVGCAPAQHFSARFVHDRSRALWGGLTIAVGGRSVYFAGDTALHPEFAEIGRRLGPFDLVLMPVGAYEPRWFMRVVHLNPEEAVEAFQSLGHAPGRPPVMLPIHWGTFKLTDEPMDEPPARTIAAWAAAGLPAERLWTSRHGETRLLGPAD